MKIEKILIAFLQLISLGLYKKIRNFKLKNKKLLFTNKDLVEIHDQYFNNLDFDKRFIYEKKINTSKKSILIFVGLLETGGIETRLIKMLPYLKEKYNIFIFTDLLTYNTTKFLQDKDIFVYLSNFQYSKNIERYLRKIISYHGINYLCVEKGRLPEVNYKNLKINNCKIILTVHGKVTTKKAKNYFYSIYNDVDAFIKVRKTHFDFDPKDGKEIFLIQNGVSEVKKVYEVNNSKKILLASRLHTDKANSIYSILNFAYKNNLEVDIAGSLADSHSQLIKSIKKNPAQTNFIGHVDIPNYLEKNASSYLFIAGLGQVIMESLAFGFPALNADVINSNLCFINKNNFINLYDYNFDYVEKEFSQTEEDLQKSIEDLQKGHIDKFQVIKDAEKHLLIKNKVKDFVDILEGL